MQLGGFLTSAELNGLSGREDWARWVDRGRAPTPQNLAGLRLEDVDLLKSLGVREIAVTAEWARLQPTERERAHLEIESFRTLLEEMVARELRPWICLVDGTLPGWFADDEGGFGDRRARTLLWPRYVDFVGELFGDLAAGWVPQREPIRRALRGELLGVAPPGRADTGDAGQAVIDVLKAEAEAVRLLAGTAPIALSLTGRNVRAKPDDVKATPHGAWLEEVSWRTIERAVVDGEIVVPGLPSESSEPLRDAYDAVLVHLRQPVEVDGTGGWSHSSVPLDEAHDESLSRARDLAGQRTLIVSADLAGVSAGDDDVEQSDGLTVAMELSNRHDAAAWWQASPIDGWHWEHGDALRPGIVDSNRELKKPAERFVSFR